MDGEHADALKAWRLSVLEALQGCGPCPNGDDETPAAGILSRWVLIEEWVDHDGCEWLHGVTGQGDGSNPPPWWTEGAMGYAFRDQGDDD